MTTTWKLMEWLADYGSGDKEGDLYNVGGSSDGSGLFSTSTSDNNNNNNPYEITPHTIVEYIASDQGRAAAVGLTVIFLGIAMVYYTTVITGKLLSWFFGFAWKITIGLILTIILLTIISVLMPWLWGICVGNEEGFYHHHHHQSEGGKEYGLGDRELDSSDMVYVLFPDGKLHPMPRWSDIGTRDRIEKRKNVHWNLLDRILGFKPSDPKNGAEFWTRLFGFEYGGATATTNAGSTESGAFAKDGSGYGEEEKGATDHIAKAFLESQTSSMVWGGAKLVGQLLTSAFVSLGKETASKIAHAGTTLLSAQDARSSDD